LGLDHVLEQLRARLVMLGKTADALRLTVVEDRPDGEQPAMVEAWEDASEDMVGWSKEAARAASRSDVDLAAGTARRVLRECRHGLRLVLVTLSELKEKSEGLAELKTWPGQWPGWVRSVEQGLDAVRDAASEVSDALVSAWDELAEATPTAWAQATAIGDQVNVSPEPRATEAGG
jgi:hypothetical protein